MTTAKQRDAKRASTKAASKAKAKPTTKPKAKPKAQAKPVVKPPVAPPVVAPVAPIVSDDLASTIASYPVPINADDLNFVGPGLKARALECHAAGKELTAAPGYHLVVVKGVLDQEADPPAAPPPKAEPTLSQQLKKAEPPKPVVAPKAAAAPKAVASAPKSDVVVPPKSVSATSEYGRVGSGAEAYRRILMLPVDGKPMTEAEVHARVIKELGVTNAGPLSYVKWYRNQLLKGGRRPAHGSGEPTGGTDRG